MDGPGADIDRKVLALMLPGLDGRLAEQVLQLMPTWNDPLTSERLAELRNTLREHTDELRAGRPLVERCITGDADPADANDVAEAWHHSDRTVSLQDVLGLDDWEFEVWSRIQPSARRSLIQAVVARRQSHEEHGVVQEADVQEAAEVTAERLRQLNERIIEAGRKAGGSYLDVYEQSLRTLAELSERAGQSQVEWVTAAVNAQADFMREMAKTSAAVRR